MDACCRYGITRKKRQRALTKTEREVFQEGLAELTTEDLVWVDECGVAQGLYRLQARWSRGIPFDSDIPTIDGNIGAFTYEADGCYALAYDMGVSFINWLLSTHGGIDTHAQIVDLLQSNLTLSDALEQTTGKTFYELENEWLPI